MAQPVLRLDDVTFRYRPSRPGLYSLRQLTLHLSPGETTVLMGPNGSGKTTLLRLAAGLLRPDSGDVHVRLNGHEEPVKKPTAAVGYIPQQLGLVRSRTVLQNVLLGGLGRIGRLSALLGTWPPTEVEQASRWIEEVGLAHKAHARVQRLSGGERQRVAIARTLHQHPKILLADEFVSSLDVHKAREVLTLARQRLGQDHVTTLITLHNVDLARRFADRIVFLAAGRVAADLPANEVTPEVAERHLAA